MSLLLLFSADPGHTSRRNRERVRREQERERLRLLKRMREEEELILFVMDDNSGSVYG